VIRRLTIGALAAGVCLLAAGPASAATNFGSTLQPPVLFGAFANSVSTPIAVAGGSATAPFSGVVTAMRVKHGTSTASPGVYAYRILSGAASPFTGRPATPSGANDVFLAWSPTVAGTDVYYPIGADGQPVGVPISAGERLALWTEKAADGSQAPAFWGSATGASAARHDGSDNASGSVAYSSFTGLEALIQGTLEADADGDRFGDDSQDLCKGVPGPERGCPSGTVFFTTKPAPVVQTVQVVQTSGGGLVQLTSATINKGRSKLQVGLACPAGRPSGCRGSIVVKTAAKVQLDPGSAAKGVLTLGSAGFKIGAGARKTLVIQISMPNRKRIASLKKLRLEVKLSESTTSTVTPAG
jgi:hypothetical protein